MHDERVLIDYLDEHAQDSQPVLLVYRLLECLVLAGVPVNQVKLKEEMMKSGNRSLQLWCKCHELLFKYYELQR